MSDLIELDDEFETIDESYDEAEFEESDDEATPRFTIFPFQPRTNFRTPSTGSGRNLYQTRPTSLYVTQTQLQAALNRVGAQVKTNSTAIAKVSAKVRSVDAAQAKQTAALKKEVVVRRKQADALKKDLKQTRDLAALMPLISRPSTVTLTSAVGTIPAGTKVMVDSGNSFSTMLPLLMMGGLGGDSSSDNNMMLFMLLALSSK